MAIATYVSRKKVLLVKVEAAKGTPLAADLPLITYDPEMMSAAEFIERSGTGLYLSATHSGLVGENIGVCNFSADLVGDTSNDQLDPALDVLFRCCGFYETGTNGLYAPAPAISDQKTCTIYLYEDGQLKRLSGCAGNVTITMEWGKPVKCNFAMQGYYTKSADAAMPAFSPSSLTPPNMDSAGTYSFDSTANLQFHNLTLETGNTLAWRAGTHYVTSARNFTATCDPESQLKADYDFDDKYSSGTTVSISAAIGAGAGEKMTLTIPALQISEPPKHADRDGIMICELKGICLPSSGNDEATLTVLQA